MSIRPDRPSDNDFDHVVRALLAEKLTDLEGQSLDAGAGPGAGAGAGAGSGSLLARTLLAPLPPLDRSGPFSNKVGQEEEWPESATEARHRHVAPVTSVDLLPLHRNLSDLFDASSSRRDSSRHSSPRSPVVANPTQKSPSQGKGVSPRGETFSHSLSPLRIGGGNPARPLKASKPSFQSLPGVSGGGPVRPVRPSALNMPPQPPQRQKKGGPKKAAPAAAPTPSPDWNPTPPSKESQATPGPVWLRRGRSAEDGDSTPDSSSGAGDSRQTSGDSAGVTPPWQSAAKTASRIHHRVVQQKFGPQVVDGYFIREVLFSQPTICKHSVNKQQGQNSVSTQDTLIQKYKVEFTGASIKKPITQIQVIFWNNVYTSFDNRRLSAMNAALDELEKRGHSLANLKIKVTISRDTDQAPPSRNVVKIGDGTINPYEEDPGSSGYVLYARIHSQDHDPESQVDRDGEPFDTTWGFAKLPKVIDEKGPVKRAAPQVETASGAGAGSSGAQFSEDEKSDTE